ncbi:MAG: CPBP family intramembrane metalloprotease, partial [Odoribacteraceae bacterium]|nr:CPBP family intramembrane metalloprotease [Odoribacteraceae bacterium]
MFLEKAYRGRDNRWYMYLFTVLVVFVAMQVGAIPFAVYNFKSLASGERVVATGSLVDLALMLFSFVVALLALLACVKYLHGKRVIDLFSGRVRFDFRRFFFAAIVWGGLTFLTFGITCLVDSSSLRFQFDLFPFLATCLVLLVFLPFQVAWEECMFRGYLMQGFAA